MKFVDKTKQFLTEVQAELGKVSWPDRKSIYGSTTVVVITTVLMVILLWIMDVIFSNILHLVFR